MDHLPSTPHFTKRIVTRRDREGNLIKRREVFAPDEDTREIHDDMLHLLYRQGLVSDHKSELSFTGGALPETQLIDNITPHRNGRTFYMLDLADAFGSVDIPTLHAKLLEKTDPALHGIITYFMENYATTPLVGGLPQGAPCSPYLFNFYLQDLDDAMVGFCTERGLAYSRWLDDITVSSPETSAVLGKHTRRRIREMVEATPGMKINHAKSHLHSRVNQPVTITGISLYPDGRVQVNPELLQAIRTTTWELAQAALHGFVTDEDLGKIHGYHSALLCMGIEPRSAIISDTIENCQAVAQLIKNAMYDQDNPRPPADPVLQRIAKSALRAMQREKHRATKQPRDDFKGIGLEALKRLREDETPDSN